MRAVPKTPAEAAPVRPAATVLLLRPAGAASAASGRGDAFEVLMLRRHARSGFAASAWVFPGGVVDDVDRNLPASVWTGIDPEAMAGRFGLSAGETLGMYAGAVREAFEEAGVLLATTSDGAAPVIDPAELSAIRHDLNDRHGEADWVGFLQRNRLVLDLSSMTYWLRWVTPIQEPKRYDTCFFLARLPEGAQPAADSVETTDAAWFSPRRITDDPAFPVIFPTRKTLEWMVRHHDIDALVAAADAQPVIAPHQPHIEVGPDGRYTGILMPDDEAYPHELYG